MCGQLVEASMAVAIERSILRRVGSAVATRDGLARLAPADLRRDGLAASRSATLVRLVRSLDLERLREHDTEVVLRRLLRERGIGPWSVGVIAIEGLGRYDHGLVGDLGLMKLLASLRGRWVEADETAELLAQYEEWQGLAGQILMLGWSRGLIPGADPHLGRRARLRVKRAA
jgi:3-methyladenine DNA glycosylase/8-oxoguanine DNA glycosylase